MLTELWRGAGMMRRWVILAAVGVLACGGSDVVAPSSVDLSNGLWQGPAGANLFTLALAARGATIEGTGTMTGAVFVRPLTVTGDYAPPSITLTMQVLTSTPFVFRGLVSATQIRGTISGPGFVGADSVVLTRIPSEIGR